MKPLMKLLRILTRLRFQLRRSLTHLLPRTVPKQKIPTILTFLHWNFAKVPKSYPKMTLRKLRKIPTRKKRQRKLMRS